MSQQGTLLRQKWPKQKSETTCISSYEKNAIYKTSNQFNERCKRSWGDKIGQILRRQSIKFQIKLMKEVRGVAGARSDVQKEGGME